MNVLVLNCGSSSAKFAVINTEDGRELVSGIAQRLGDIYQEVGDADAAERYLVWTVRRLLSDPEALRQNEWRRSQAEAKAD